MQYTVWAETVTGIDEGPVFCLDRPFVLLPTPTEDPLAAKRKKKKTLDTFARIAFVHESLLFLCNIFQEFQSKLKGPMELAPPHELRILGNFMDHIAAVFLKDHEDVPASFWRFLGDQKQAAKIAELLREYDAALKKQQTEARN